MADVLLDLAIKRFEFTYEMAWKAIKRTLNMLGIENAYNPRACFKEAYSQGLIKEQDIWLDMIEMRNLSSHTYDEDEMQQLIDKLPVYKEKLNALYEALEQQLEA